MHHFDANISKFPGGDHPDPHLREGVTPSPTLPLSALRASLKPSASLVTCAPPPAVEVLDPPLAVKKISCTNYGVVNKIKLKTLKGHLDTIGLNWSQCLQIKFFWLEILLEFLQKVIQKCTNLFGKDWTINRAEITHKKYLFVNIVTSHLCL